MGRRDTGNLMNLDSLMDTITNVVGFLVIVLAVVQLNLSQTAIKTSSTQPAPTTRVAREPTSHPAPDPVLAERARKTDVDIQELESRLPALMQQIATRKAEAATQPSLDESTTRRDRLEDLIHDLREDKTKLEDEIKEAQNELASLHLPTTAPTQPEREVEQVEGIAVLESTDAEPVNFICCKGRLFRLDSQGLEKNLVAAVRACLNLPGTSQIQIGREEAQKLVTYFDRNVIGDEFIRVKLSLVDFGPLSQLVATYAPRSDVQGETAEMLKGGKSRHEKFLADESKKAESQRAWVKYYVWDDSFETYRLARKVAKKHELGVGWRPVDPETGFQVLLGGGGGRPPGEKVERPR